MANTFKFGNGNWAVKDGYALAYNDENNNFKPLPFDFTRASSATRVNKQGLIETVPSGKPRIDFLDNTSGHLLLEPSRTNIILRSEDLSTTWITAGANVSTNEIVSPDGTQNADKLTITSTGGSVYQQNLTVTASTNYIFTFYVKRGTIASDETALAIYNQSASNFIVQNVSYTASETEWTRITYSFTTPSGCTSVRVYPQRKSGEGLGTTFLWGCQLELGSYATSYIPTEGSSVTRSKDDIDNENTEVLSLPNSASFYWNIKGQTEGNDGNNTGHAIRFRTNPSSGSNSYFGLNSTSTVWRIRLQDGSSSNFKSLSISKFEDVKVVVIVATSTYSIYANGAAIWENQSYSGTAPTIEKIMRVQSDMANDAKGVIRVVDLKVYNTELTATEAINLTS